jgi:hypothetical protein
VVLDLLPEEPPGRDVGDDLRLRLLEGGDLGQRAIELAREVLGALARL